MAKDQELANQILHLERKFTTATETFIVNQINVHENYEHQVFTNEFLDTLIVTATVYYPEKIGFLSDKLLSKNIELKLKTLRILVHKGIA